MIEKKKHKHFFPEKDRENICVSSSKAKVLYFAETTLVPWKTLYIDIYPWKNILFENPLNLGRESKRGLDVNKI